MSLRVALAVGITVVAASASAGAPAAARPLLVTVDGLPVAADRLHPDGAERDRIMRDLIAVLAKHNIPAVGFVIWGNVRGDGERALLEGWVEAGYELGNHAGGHLDDSSAAADALIADAAAGRAGLAGLLGHGGRTVRFLRCPYLEEGASRTELDAMRAYLERSGERNVPVTIDAWDWSYEERWVAARRGGDRAEMRRIGEEYQAAIRGAVLTQTRLGDSLFGRAVPQVLLLHANEVGAAQWDALFTWMSASGYRFARADEVMADPAIAARSTFLAGAGGSAWERVARERGRAAARTRVTALLGEQAAAWNRGDLDGFCAVYDEDAVFVTPGGLTRGRQAVLERYKARYPTHDAMGSLTLEPIEFREAGGTRDDPAVGPDPPEPEGMSLVARWTLRMADGSQRSGLTLLVLHRLHGRWLIVQDASM